MGVFELAAVRGRARWRWPAPWPTPSAVSVVGGGDSVAAVNAAGVADRHHPRLHRRRRGARADRGQAAARRGRAARSRRHERATAVRGRQLEDAQDRRGDRPLRGRAGGAAAGRARGGRVRAVHVAGRGGRGPPPDRSCASTPRTCTRPPQGAYTGEISAADAARPGRARRAARPLGAAPVLRRDRRRAGREAGRRRRRRSGRDPGRGRDASRQREGGETEQVLARQIADSGAAAHAARADHRLRADLGDRHRPHRHAGDGRGGAPLHPRAAAERARRASPHPVRRQHEAGQRRRAAGAAGHRRRPDRRRQPGGGRFPGDRAPRRRERAGLPGGAGRLGPGRARARQRRRPGRYARLRPRSGRPGRAPRWPPRDGRSACPTARWATREVGHLNLGAGRVVLQDLVRIDEDVASGGIFQQPVLLRRLRARAAARRCTWSACVSDGGVHSHIRPPAGADRAGAPRAASSGCTCTRSPTGATSRPPAAPASWSGCRNLATVCGRFFGMDRDRRWDRTKRAYDAIVHGVGAVHRRPGGGRAGRVRAAASPTSSSSRSWSATQRRLGCAATMPWCSSTSGPTAAGSCSARCSSPASTSSTAGMTRRCRALVQMTEYSEDFHAPVAYPSRAGDVGAGAGAGGKPACRSCTWPRRRSTRTSPTSSTAAASTAASGEQLVAGRLAARRRHLRPEAGDERRRRLPTCSATASRRAATGSAWSTSPTPTWSATAA